MFSIILYHKIFKNEKRDLTEVKSLKITRKKVRGKDQETVSRERRAVTGVVGAVPAHAELVTDTVPGHARHAASVVPRTRTERPVVDVEMLSGLLEVLQFVDEPFFQGDAGNLLPLQVVGGLVLQFAVSFDSVSDPDGIGAVLGSAIGSDNLVEIVVRPHPDLEQLLALVEQTLRSHPRNQDQKTVKTFLSPGNNYSRKVDLDLENFFVELLPGHDGVDVVARQQ